MWVIKSCTYNALSTNLHKIINDWDLCFWPIICFENWMNATATAVGVFVGPFGARSCVMCRPWQPNVTNFPIEPIQLLIEIRHQCNLIKTIFFFTKRWILPTKYVHIWTFIFNYYSLYILFPPPHNYLLLVCERVQRKKKKKKGANVC